MQIHEITKKQHIDEGILDSVKNAVSAVKTGAQNIVASPAGQAVKSVAQTGWNATKRAGNAVNTRVINPIAQAIPAVQTAKAGLSAAKMGYGQGQGKGNKAGVWSGIKGATSALTDPTALAITKQSQYNKQAQTAAKSLAAKGYAVTTGKAKSLTTPQQTASSSPFSQYLNSVNQPDVQKIMTSFGAQFGTQGVTGSPPINTTP